MNMIVLELSGAIASELQGLSIVLVLSICSNDQCCDLWLAPVYTVLDLSLLHIGVHEWIVLHIT